jgi:hypothetical protein
MGGKSHVFDAIPVIPCYPIGIAPHFDANILIAKFFDGFASRAK